MDFDIVPFDKNKHNREKFDCGTQELNDYLLMQADEDVRANAARLFIAKTPASNDILGYYTLSSTGIDKRSLPENNGLPRYADVPSILLGRLAVDKTTQGKGLGVRLLANAIIRSLEDSSAWAIMVVDPKDPKEEVQATNVGSDNPRELKPRDPAEFYTKLGLFTLLKKKGKRRLYAKRTDLESWITEARILVAPKHEIKIMISSEEKEILETIAKSQGLTLTDYAANLLKSVAQAESKQLEKQQTHV